jgi:hypothetical protein
MWGLRHGAASLTARNGRRLVAVDRALELVGGHSGDADDLRSFVNGETGLCRNDFSASGSRRV